MRLLVDVFVNVWQVVGKGVSKPLDQWRGCVVLGQ
ncbi:hypothetical protein FHS42_004620 [Streptomyces zagrosensis]|uniref:Uncharacterized protein n=1 Tax=Streptomyces zagrosensis TaxID=1042984 RepID=A0A7W9QCS1_9ACTN|nr:hypothetical protein [Streptomyces zagrosensis]